MKTSVKLLLFVLAASLSWTPAAWAGPCDVITQKDAEAILGEAVKPGRESKLAGFAAGLACTYYTAAPLQKRGKTGSVGLSMFDAETMKKEDSMYTSPEKYFQRRKKVFAKSKSAKMQDVPGLGEGAFWLAGGERLHLLHGGIYYVLSIKDMADIGSSKTLAEMHAKLAAHRLKLCEDAARKYILK